MVSVLASVAVWNPLLHEATFEAAIFREKVATSGIMLELLAAGHADCECENQYRLQFRRFLLLFSILPLAAGGPLFSSFLRLSFFFFFFFSSHLVCEAFAKLIIDTQS